MTLLKLFSFWTAPYDGHISTSFSVNEITNFIFTLFIFPISNIIYAYNILLSSQVSNVLTPCSEYPRGFQNRQFNLYDTRIDFYTCKFVHRFLVFL